MAEHLAIMIILTEKKVCFRAWGFKGMGSIFKRDKKCSKNGKLGRLATCKHILKNLKGQLPYINEKRVIVRFDTINLQQPLLDDTVH